MSSKIACGECFPWAWKLVKAGGSNAILVHAIVTHPWDKNKFPHGWVELDGLVYDWQSQVIRKIEPVTIETFYQIWKPENIHKYNKEEALTKLVQEKHYGPWNNRKNPDFDIRQLEKIAFTTKLPEDILNYWNACLRAEIIPKPSHEARDETFVVWYLTRPKPLIGELRYYGLIWDVPCNDDPDNIGFFTAQTLHGNIQRESSVAGVTKWHNESIIKDLLKWILEQYLIEQSEQTYRKNPDQKIRKLERESGDELEIAIQKLRAGIPLQPTQLKIESWYGTADFNFFEARRIISVHWIQWSGDKHYIVKIGVMGAQPWAGQLAGEYTNLYEFPPMTINNANDVLRHPQVVEKIFEALVAPPVPVPYGPEQPYPNNYWPQSFFI